MDKDASKQYLKMTQTPIPRLVVTLGIPTTVSMLVTNIYNMADTSFVSKLGTSASGAVGVVFGLYRRLDSCLDMEPEVSFPENWEKKIGRVPRGLRRPVFSILWQLAFYSRFSA